jgi:hypothetical protein
LTMYLTLGFCKLVISIFYFAERGFQPAISETAD